MPSYIGRQPSFGLFEKQSFTPNGIDHKFTLDFQVGSATSLLVVYGGVIQEPGPGKSYTLDNGGQTLVFSFIPQLGNNLYVIYMGRELMVPRTIGLEPNLETFTAAASQDTFTLANGPVNDESIIVFVDQQMQRLTDDFTVNINDVIFNTPLSGGERVDVYIHGVEKTEFSSLSDGIVTTPKIFDGAVTNPKVGFTFQDFVPNIQAFGGMTISSLTVHEAKYMKLGDLVKVRVHFTCDFCGTLDSLVRISDLPIDNNGSTNMALAATLSSTSGGDIVSGVGIWAGIDEVDVHRDSGVLFTVDTWDIKVNLEYIAA